MMCLTSCGVSFTVSSERALMNNALGVLRLSQRKARMAMSLKSFLF